MKRLSVTVVGTGYVGLVSGTCLAEVGHQVVCLDSDLAKVEKLRSGQIPIHEPGLDELVSNNLGRNLRFTAEYPYAIRSADVVMIAVGTPSSADGSADLSSVRGAAAEVVKYLDSPKVIAVKSTVPVGTGDKLEEFFWAALRERGVADPSAFVAVVSNPEFLREGRAVSDFMRGDRVVVGGSNPAAVQMVTDLYTPLGIPVVTCDRRSSEMIKYASNAFLATKISFINSMAQLCAKLGADVTSVARGMGYDHRIGAEHLRAGLGYGGSCFPKDVAALSYMGREVGVQLKILDATEEVNAQQIAWAVDLLEETLETLKGKTVCLWGIAFKPDTDDVRDAPFMRLARLLQERGASIQAYDPIAKPLSLPEGVILFRNAYESAADADAAVLVTEWTDFGKMDWRRVRKVMRGEVIVDTRNFFNPGEVRENGFVYRDFGRSATTGKTRVDQADRAEECAS